MFQFTASYPSSSLDQLFDGLFRQTRTSLVPRSALPVSVTEQDGTYTLTAQLLDGVQKEHVSVEIDDGVVTLSVKKDVPAHAEGANVLFDERRAIDVTRSFNFSEGLADEGHDAKVSNGTLTLVLKRAAVRTPQKLTIA